MTKNNNRALNLTEKYNPAITSIHGSYPPPPPPPPGYLMVNALGTLHVLCQNLNYGYLLCRLYTENGGITFVYIDLKLGFVIC